MSSNSPNPRCQGPAAGPSGSSPTEDPSGSSLAEDPSGSSSNNKRPPADIGSGLADKRAFQFDPATQISIGLDPGAIQAVSAASGARSNTQRWNDSVKLELQHLAAATPSGTSLVAIQRHVPVTLATWDAVWGEYLHAREKVLERYFKKVIVPRLEEEAAIESQKRWGTRKKLMVFFGNARIDTRGRVKGKVVTVDEFRTNRVSSAMNRPQPCEEELDRSKPTRLEGWKPQPGQVQNRLLRSAWSKRFEAPVRELMWCPWLHQATPGDIGEWVDRDCNAALNLQRAGEGKWCRWKHRARLPAKGKEYPALGFKKL
ncbi:hypothetical protein QJQ45_004037 [Haematococcus lacustris]|nr:hypothetical protein QJQ45_004037 [Haematococcus lacustris]